MCDTLLPYISGDPGCCTIILVPPFPHQIGKWDWETGLFNCIQMPGRGLTRNLKVSW